MGVTTSRILAIIFALLFVMSGIVVVSSPASALTSGDFEYQLINGDLEVEIVGYNGKGGNVIIPYEIGGKPVTVIGNYSFYNQQTITSITIPSTVISIGTSAISGCYNLYALTLDNGVRIIGDNAFEACLSLPLINVPDSVVSIGSKAFSGCLLLETVNLGFGITSMGDHIFDYCYALKSINVNPENEFITSVNGLLYDKEITILKRCPEGVEGSINIPTSVTMINDWAFSNCADVNSVAMHMNISYIGVGAFYGCALTSITIPDGVTTIPSECFRLCHFLESVIIGSGVLNIDYLAFSNCESLKMIIFSGSISPSSVAPNWISGTTESLILGHALTTSNFPLQGDYFYGLLMGSPLNILEKPTNITLSFNTNRVNLNWVAPNNDNLLPIDYYIVYQDEIRLSQHFEDVTASLNISADDGGHSYKIAAHNALGIGALSDTISYRIPGIPSQVNADIGNGAVSLSWNPPLVNGGAPIDYYIVLQDDVEVERTNFTTITIFGLINDQTYSFSVIAHNYAGTGDVSDSVFATPSQTVPTTPLNVTASPFDSRVLLTWSEPQDDGGYVITSYSIYRAENGGAITSLSTVNSTIRQYIDTANTPGQSYVYYVQAINELGASAYSDGSLPMIAYSLVKLDIGSVSSVTGLGIINTLTGRISLVSNDQPITGLEITLAYSVNNGNSWIDLPTVISSSDGSFNRSWIPTAEGVYLIRAAWLGNDQYPSAESIFSLAITISTANDIFTVQSNSVISNLLFNSETKQLSFTVSGESGTSGYTKIIISKELVADGNDIIITLDGASMNYELSSTDTSWVLYFTYSHSSHNIVADLNSEKGLLGGDGDTTLLAIGLVLIALVSIIIITVLYRKQKGKK